MAGFIAVRVARSVCGENRANSVAALHCHNVLARSLDDGATWSIENPPGYSDYDRSKPEIRDCAALPGTGVPFGHPDLVFEIVWMEHTSDEMRRFFHWSTDLGESWSARYRLPMLNGHDHLEPRTDHLVDGPSKAIVFVSGDNMTTSTRPTWTGAWISAYHTTDGGKTWTASTVGEMETGVWKGMTSSVRVGPAEILTSVRNHRIVNKPHPGRIESLADVYSSTNNGVSWQFRSTPWMLEENVFGNPASLVKLPSGKIASLMAKGLDGVVKGVSGPRFIPGSDDFVLAMENGQLGRYVVATDTIVRLTDDAGSGPMTDPVAFRAPEMGNQVLIVAIENRQNVVVYQPPAAAGGFWTRRVTLPVPAASTESYVYSVEPFTVGGRSYCSLHLQLLPVTPPGDTTSSVWVYAMDPVGGVRLARRLDDGTAAHRIDPEWFIGQNEVFIYFNLLPTDGGPWQVHRARKGIAAP